MLLKIPALYTKELGKPGLDHVHTGKQLIIQHVVFFAHRSAGFRQVARAFVFNDGHFALVKLHAYVCRVRVHRIMDVWKCHQEEQHDGCDGPRGGGRRRVRRVLVRRAVIRAGQGAFFVRGPRSLRTTLPHSDQHQQERGTITTL